MTSPPVPAVRERNEVRALGDLLEGALAGGVGVIRDVHLAASGRPFHVLGLLGAPVRVMHDAISSGVYAGVAGATSAMGKLGSVAASTLLPPKISDSPHGRVVLGALNGAVGDRLLESGSDVAIDMTLRSGDRDLTPDELASVYPDATGRLVIFVHGLGETDEAWGRWPGRFGSSLREELGYTPLQVRYNSGLRISVNGRALAELIESIAAAWPVDVEEIALVGHSMGGLVARGACHYGSIEGQGWAGSLRHVFCLGSPHLGAPLEKLANVGGWALRHLPETRPFAEVVNGRSVGIKDLRYGSLLEEEWADCDPDELLTDRCSEVPFVEGAKYYFIGATLSREPGSPLGRAVGDLLVLYPSASGKGRKRRIPFEAEHGHHLGGLSHFHLLRHPAVYEQLRSWLGRSANAVAHAR
jgi:pimeloyl-ACP methyl ester carboxylesterase